MKIYVEVLNTVFYLTVYRRWDVLICSPASLTFGHQLPPHILAPLWAENTDDSNSLAKHFDNCKILPHHQLSCFTDQLFGELGFHCKSYGQTKKILKTQHAELFVSHAYQFTFENDYWVRKPSELPVYYQRAASFQELHLSLVDHRSRKHKIAGCFLTLIRAVYSKL